MLDLHAPTLRPNPFFHVTNVQTLQRIFSSHSVNEIAGQFRSFLQSKATRSCDLCGQRGDAEEMTFHLKASVAAMDAKLFINRAEVVCRMCQKVIDLPSLLQTSVDSLSATLDKDGQKKREINDLLQHFLKVNSHDMGATEKLQQCLCAAYSLNLLTKQMTLEPSTRFVTLQEFIASAGHGQNAGAALDGKGKEKASTGAATSRPSPSSTEETSKRKKFEANGRLSSSPISSSESPKRAKKGKNPPRENPVGNGAVQQFVSQKVLKQKGKGKKKK